MSRISRVIVIVFFVVVLIVVALSVALVVTVRGPFPDTEGTISPEGLEGEVDVFRDEYGVPHIFATNEHDLFFAQGYVHAQDRFWQMEFWRHTGQGRLAEIVGAEELIETDKFIRTLGWNRMAQLSLDYYEEEMPEVITLLEAYSAGVNAYLDSQDGATSLNQQILELSGDAWELEPWEPLDTLSWGMVMAYQLSGNWDSELAIAEANRELGEATVATVLPFYPYDERPVIAPMDRLSNLDELEEAEPDAESGRQGEAVAWEKVNVDLVGVPPALELGLDLIGSNNWVVSGAHTASGLPLLANDPHLGVQMPSIWYEVSLHAPGWNVAGFSFAGVPGVIIGHNEQIAWGVTTSNPDVQDLYIEKVNPSNPDQYEFEGEWREMEVLTEVIKVNGGEDIEVEVRQTHHGPIISEVVDGTNDVLALRWVAQEPSRLFRAIVLLNQAENYEDFREAMRYYDVPSQNVVYADVEGNIAYMMPGRVPIRENGDGLTPVPGWTGEYEWEGYIPFEHLPVVLNPEEGFIVTANNAVVEPAYPYLISHYYASGDRAQRITELLEEAIADGPVTADDYARIQMDNKVLLAETYLALLEGLSSDDPEVQAAIERLRGWDLQASRDSVPATIFEIFYVQLANAVLADELGEMTGEIIGGAPSQTFFYTLARQPEAVWWDNVQTEEEETQQEIILQALRETVDWLEENVGDDMESWRWGDLHTITFVSDPLGQSGIAVVEWLVNRGPFPVAGSSRTVNANSWSWDNPAEVRGHPSMRMIVDLSDFDASRGVHPTGQSGHPFHRHYDDLIEMWLDGEYHPMWFSREAINEAAVDHLVLQPPVE